jgi:CMP-N,N'-diacetyllegionaminic acid synthase
VRTVVAFVPAEEANVRPLAGHPLIDYTIASALDAGVFTDVVVSASPGIEWLLEAIRDRPEDAFAILRPRSPFLRAATIRRAWERLLELAGRADSVRAVERCRQHPAKMWRIEGKLLRPVLERPDDGTPWHSLPYQALPDVWIESSSLEMSWRHVLDGDSPAISGERVSPFFTEGLEGFSIDSPEDFERAERLVEQGKAGLPRVVKVLGELV